MCYRFLRASVALSVQWQFQQHLTQKITVRTEKKKKTISSQHNKGTETWAVIMSVSNLLFPHVTALFCCPSPGYTSNSCHAIFLLECLQWVHSRASKIGSIRLLHSFLQPMGYCQVPHCTALFPGFCPPIFSTSSPHSSIPSRILKAITEPGPWLSLGDITVNKIGICSEALVL